MATAPVLTVDCWVVDVSGLPDAQTARWDAATAPQRERAAVLAATALRALTGGAVEPCAYVVRPCSRPCTPLTYQTYPVFGTAGSSGFAPRLDSGSWINLRCGDCGADDCGHSLSSIRLPGATEVTDVWVDGAELADDAWRLHNDRLYRLDGTAWPSCQNLGALRTEPNTFEVTYYRRRPGASGEQALGRLASEYLPGGACAMPSNATAVTRTGVTITKTPGAYPGGLTGVREVDAWVQAVNPSGLKAPSEVLSPDGPRY